MIRFQKTHNQIELGGTVYKLSPQQFRVLKILASGKTYTLLELAHELWPNQKILATDSRILRVYIYQLRKRLGKNIITTSRLGYTINANP